MASSSNRLSRARPLLGTLVEISVIGDSPAHHDAVQQAFAEIERIHALMSFHEASSDVSRLNREAHLHPAQVATDTWAVLALALQLSRDSDGAFDITVGSTLQAWGFLPGQGPSGAERGCWSHIELLGDYQVRFSQPLSIDLGGIAKGYAVDRAAARLEALGLVDYVVNAGGDLRVGRQPEPVQLRHPGNPGLLLALPPLAHAAIATSASYFAGQEIEGEWLHPLVMPATRRPVADTGSISVISPNCVTADALTKVVAVLGEQAGPILAKYHSRALWIDVDGNGRELNPDGADPDGVAAP